MPQLDMRDRTKRFAAQVVRFVERLPSSRANIVTGDQLLRSATSVAANYRAARRARSRREFIAKLGIVEEEADETVFWLELMVEAGVVDQERVRDLHREADELTAIIVASIKTAKNRQSPTRSS